MAGKVEMLFFPVSKMWHLRQQTKTEYNLTQNFKLFKHAFRHNNHIFVLHII